MNRIRLKALMRSTLVGALVGLSAELLRVAHFSLLSWSPYALFTGISILRPLAGLYGGVWAIMVAQFVKIGAAMAINGSVAPLFLSLVYHDFLSTSLYWVLAQLSSVFQLGFFFASLYWVVVHKGLGFRLALSLVPLACMALFILHPVGGVAWTYTLLWWIPVCTLLIPRANLFLHALGSTCMAHAIGSIGWLATHSLTAEQWMGLIPVAVIERCCMAAVMVLCIQFIAFCTQIQHFHMLKNKAAVVVNK